MLNKHDSRPMLRLEEGFKGKYRNYRESVQNSSPQELQCYSLWEDCSNILGYCKFEIVKIVTPGPIMSSDEGCEVYHRNI